MRPARILVPLAALFLVTALVSFPVRWKDIGTFDWIAYWSIPRSLVLGDGYLNQQRLAAMQQAVGYRPVFLGDVPSPVWRAWNPPPLLLLLLPFALQPFGNATLLWLLATVCLLSFATWQYNRALDQPLPPLLALAVMAIASPLYPTLWVGQMLGMMSAFLLLAGVAARRGRSTAAGLLLLPVLLKPQVVLATGALVVCITLRRRDWRLLGASLGMLLLLAVATFRLDPAWPSRWLGQGSPVEWPTFAPLHMAVILLGLPIPWLLAGSALGLLAALWHYRKDERLTFHRLGESTILSLLIAPYAINVELLILLPATLWLLGQLWQQGRRWLVILFILVSNPLMAYNPYRVWFYLGSLSLLWLVVSRARATAAPAAPPATPSLPKSG